MAYVGDLILDAHIAFPHATSFTHGHHVGQNGINYSNPSSTVSLLRKNMKKLYFKYFKLYQQFSVKNTMSDFVRISTKTNSNVILSYRWLLILIMKTCEYISYKNISHVLKLHLFIDNVPIKIVFIPNIVFLPYVNILYPESAARMSDTIN